MVGAPGTARAVELARRCRGSLSDCIWRWSTPKPVLPLSAVPDLVDKRGRFRANMALSGAAMFFLPHVRKQMRAEIRAQFEAFRSTGLNLDHVNAHKHFHLHPSILSAISSWRRNSACRRFARRSSLAQSSLRSKRLAWVSRPWLTRLWRAFSARV